MNKTRSVRVTAGLVSGIGLSAALSNVALSVYTNYFANLPPEQFDTYPFRI